MGFVSERIGRRLARYLQRPSHDYVAFCAIAPDRLRAVLRPGDVLLVEGDLRISSAIKYFTHSSWSHAAFFTGDAPGAELIEANLEQGVTTAPLAKYDRLNTRIKPTDLFEFGLIPEFAGRLPIVATFQPLSREMLVRIMTEPRNSIYNQFREIFRQEGVHLAVAPQVFEEISELAIEYKVGARSLRGIFEEMVTPVLYEIPDRADVRRVEIDSLFADPRLLAG